jgi:probable phosphoglycerate mutase
MYMANFMGTLLRIAWIYIVVGGRFVGWRIQLWLQPDYLRASTNESTNRRMKRTLLIIRHGQTTWNVEHRLPGQLPGVALTDTGREQAARLAESLSALPISNIITSPLERARETAEYIAQGRDLNLQFEPDLMDTDVGDWAGKVLEDLSKNDQAWKAYVKDPTVAPEGVETFPQVQQRVVAAIERWLKKESIGAYPAFVAHADVIKLLVAYYTGLEAGRAGTLVIDNASVSLIELEDSQRPRVLAIGWSPRPGWLKPPALEGAKSEKEKKGQKGELQEQEAGEQKT